MHYITHAQKIQVYFKKIEHIRVSDCEIAHKCVLLIGYIVNEYRNDQSP